MRDRLGTVLYIGKAKNLKKRVRSYFQSSKKFTFDRPKIELMMSLVEDIDITVVHNETEALLLESKLIKEFKPHYNTALRDDKRFLMIRLNLRRDLPEFSLARIKTDNKSQYFGPFVNSISVKKTLAEMRTQFGVLIGDSQPKRIKDDTYLLYDDARAEIYNESLPITREIYLSRIHEACRFLEGQSKDWLEELELKMLKYSEDLEFEKAAQSRDLITAIKESLVKNRSFMREPIQAKNKSEMDMISLKKALQMDVLPRHIECFDISHISGTFVVASMVQFKEGIPSKQNERISGQ
jgi:excinuclease ABC subunit C